MTTDEIKEWLRKCIRTTRSYEDHIMAESYEATLAKINADEVLIAELVEALEDYHQEGCGCSRCARTRAALAKAKAVQE
jgi:hypothetical protein